MYGCLPYFYPALPAFFIQQFTPNHSKTDSISCSSVKLQELAADIAKLSAMNVESGDERLIEGDVAVSSSGF